MINTEFNLVAKKEKPTLTYNQKTFNKLIKTVKDLQIKQKETDRDLDIALQFYYASIKPDEAVLLQSVIERINIAYQFYKTPKNLSKAELKVFKEWLAEEVGEVFATGDFHEIPAEIKSIFKELNGVACEDEFAEELEATKDQIRERFKKLGIDIDLSDINASDPQEEIMRKIFLKMGQAASDNKNFNQENFSEAPKTKKQLEKELKKNAFEAMQAKSLSSIYKQLARALHPDLEQNIEQKIWKEELMKKLTTAYDDNDLYSLLTIEMEWMNRSAGKMQSQNDDELKVYNSILRDQVKELEATIDMLWMHPRYIPIQRFYNNKFDGISSLKKAHIELKKLIQNIQGNIARLKTPEVKIVFKEIIKELIKRQSFMPQEFMPCRCGSC